jgi:hypothetical protein
MRGKHKAGCHHHRSNEHYKQKLVRVLFNSGSDGNLVFVNKYKPMLLPYLKRLVPQSWNTKYCNSILIGNSLSLEGISLTHKINILRGLAMAVHQVQLSQPRHAPMAESTVADTLDHAVAIFRENGYNKPQTGR